MNARRSLVFFSLVVCVLFLASQSASAQRGDWDDGYVFCGVSNGSYMVFDKDGNYIETISDGLGGYTTGCAFNKESDPDKFYTTNFSNTKVIVYDVNHPHTILQTIDTSIYGGGQCESIVFDGFGNFYVGHPDGNGDIIKFDTAGNHLANYDVAIEDRGSDWMDLSSDQKTMFYTSEGRRVFRYDVSTSTQLTDFASLPGSGVAYAFRLLPPYDGSGGLIVADTSEIKRLDGSGALIQTYDAAGEDTWFSLNLDPNGTSFWAGNFGSAQFYKFNIATGAVEIGPVNTGTGSSTLFGICVLGEITGASEPLNLVKMDEGGPVETGANLTYTITFDNLNPVDVHGVELVDTLPDDTVFVSATGGTGGWTYTYDAGPPQTVTWDIGTLTAGTTTQSVQVTVTVTAPPNTTITNQCTIDSDETIEEQASVDTDVTEATLVQLVFFTATGHGIGTWVEVEWETASEIDNAGFHIWRTKTGNDADSDYVRLTEFLIPAKGGPTSGANYTFVDRWVVPGQVYHYRLEDISYGGESYLHEPTSTKWRRD